MKVFVAGASGAIGVPLITELIGSGHEVTGMTRSQDQAIKLSKLGAKVAIVDAFDAKAVADAIKIAQPEVVIDELTSLPKDPADYGSAFEGDRKLRLEGGTILHQAAMTAGVRRYIQQSSGYFLQTSGGLADEAADLTLDASPGIAGAARVYFEVEERLARSGNIEGVALRYGIFYGPNTWYSPDGAAADHARRQELPIIGEGDGVWSFIHIHDAATATVAAMTSPAGVYNIVDDDPSSVRDWLPAFARSVGAPPPPQFSVEEATKVAGEDAVYYGTKLRGASNAKARKILNFIPRRLEWFSEISPQSQEQASSLR
ncbi:NAD-dependent epimerase/dehydratase family protein [Acidicapsa ligni]|uniref:NAD-dependent epimerase/dehydratase family protein n=1 Tax=Acidicapsa ligni TaxID=542300 RepID=UPI0021E0331E|nr:NAD(P)-dependent oxidoreductase [Acidicapsa ligni]